MAQINGKDVHRRPTDVGTSEQDRLFPFEMVLPSISPRVEPSRQLVGRWIDSGDIGSFVVVAREAGECEVLVIIRAVVFLAFT